MKLIPLSHSRSPGQEPFAYAIVDDDDYERISKHAWYLADRGYARSSIDGKIVSMHRVVARAGPYGPDNIIDHRNRNKLDNRKYNLRHTDEVKNSQNRTGTPFDRVAERGVSAIGKSWRGRVRAGGVLREKRFKTKEQAMNFVQETRSKETLTSAM